MNSKVRSYESHLDNLEVKLSDKLHELQKLQEHHKTLLDEKVVLRARSNDLNKTLSEKNCEIQVLVEEAGSYAAKVSDVKNKLSEKIESLRQLEEHNKRLCKENAVFEEDNKRLCKENAVFEEDNKRLCKENAVFEDSLSLLNDEVERQRVSYSDLKVQSDAIEVELKQVKDQNFSMATLIEQLEYQQKALMTQFVDIQGELDQCYGVTSKNLKELDSYCAKNKELLDRCIALLGESNR